MANPGAAGKVSHENSGKMASCAVARQLHQGRYCVYVANETVFAGPPDAKLLSFIKPLEYRDDPDA